MVINAESGYFAVASPADFRLSSRGSYVTCHPHPALNMGAHADGTRRRMTDWPKGRSLHGGVDEVPLPPSARGRLWLCGKHFIGPDPDGALDRVGATAAVCLTEAAELVDRYPGYVGWLQANQPARALWWPIPDLYAPELDDAVVLLGQLRSRLRSGQSLLLHCGAGIGRAGTVAAGLLVSMGWAPADAVAHVAAHRPMAGPEAGAQRDLLAALALRLKAEEGRS
jgi:protein-tyrosine phosphatase